MTDTPPDDAADPPDVAPDPPVDILATEVFSAIQGEAALVGERQVFVRLNGCNIRCAYCDQPEALEKRPGPCRIEHTPGRRDWTVGDSPLPITALVSSVQDLWRRLPHHSVSLTGGEPLMQSGPVVELARQLASAGMGVMLETNGTLVAALARALPWLTYVSMDVKLPSVDDERVRPDTQWRFLDTALRSGVSTWVKLVIGASVDLAEFDRAIDMVAELDRTTGRNDRDGGGDRSGPPTEVFLQPVTPFGAVHAAPSPDQVLDLQGRALERYPRIRVVPQTHKAIGQL